MLIKVRCTTRKHLTTNNVHNLQNLVQGELVNGSVGQVIAFYSSLEAQNTNTDFALVDRGSGVEQNPADAKPVIPQALLKNPTRWPVVRFTNGMTKLCTPTDFTIENVHGRLEASRTQVMPITMFIYRR